MIITQRPQAIDDRETKHSMFFRRAMATSRFYWKRPHETHTGDEPLRFATAPTRLPAEAP